MPEAAPKQNPVRAIANWHAAVAKELASPVIPNGLTAEAEAKKRKQIDRQREQHEMCSQALFGLLEVRRSQKA